MNDEAWDMVKHFSKDEAWGNPAKMSKYLIFMLDSLRGSIKKPIVIHCGYEHRPSGYHPFGQAVDCHAEGISLFEFYTAASRFGFSGIGIYPYWNNPGLHLDVRQGLSSLMSYPRSLWGCWKPKRYVPLDISFFKVLIS